MNFEEFDKAIARIKLPGMEFHLIRIYPTKDCKIVDVESIEYSKKMGYFPVSPHYFPDLPAMMIEELYSFPLIFCGGLALFMKPLNSYGRKL